MQRYRGTISWAPNLAYAICAKRLSDEDLEGLDLSSWRLAINASEPVLARTVEAFTRRLEPLGFRPEAMTPAYGLAETVVMATVQPVREAIGFLVNRLRPVAKELECVPYLEHTMRMAESQVTPPFQLRRSITPSL